MYTPARDLAECAWVEKVVLYIDALPVFLKIVVVFREKVGGFRTFEGCFCRDTQWFSKHNGLLPIFRVM